MKRSQIYREAAERIDDYARDDPYFFQAFPVDGDEYVDAREYVFAHYGYVMPDQDKSVRILALCFMAAIAEDEEQS